MRQQHIVIGIIASLAVGGAVWWCWPTKAPTTTYPPLPPKTSIDDGDIVLFRHREASSLRLQFLESQFSHVGIAVTLRNGTMGIVEMVARGDLDALGRPEESGRTFTPLEDRCRTFDGVTCVRKLRKPLSRGEKCALAMAIGAEGSVEYDEAYTRSYMTECVFGMSNLIAKTSAKKMKNCARFVWDVLVRIGLVDFGGHWKTSCVEPGWFGKLYFRAYSDDVYRVS